VVAPFDESGPYDLGDDSVGHARNRSGEHRSASAIGPPGPAGTIAGVSTQWTPTPRELADLELVSVQAWPPDEPFRVALPEGVTGEVQLLDPEGVPLALYDPARGVVTTLEISEFGAFRGLHVPPAEVRRDHPGAFVVLVSAPLTREDITAVVEHATTSGSAPVLLVLTGVGAPQGISAPALVRATLAAARDVPGATVVAASVAARETAEETATFASEVAGAYGDEVLTVIGEGALPAEVAAVVRKDRPPLDERGLVVFFTGLSGSGKSTLARALHDLLLERGDRTVTTLDGDVVRHHLSKGLGFSREDRETNIARIGWVAAEISRHHGVAICSPIAPFASTRALVRQMVTDAGGSFALIHVATPLQECERRDRKGLYARARAGEIPEFTGISSPYDEPDDALVRVDTTGRSIPDALDDVLRSLRGAGMLS